MMVMNIVQFIIIYVFGNAHAVTLIQKTFRRVVSFDNTIITASSTSSTGSVGHCATECAGIPNCVSFFFNIEMGTCSCHLKVFDSIDPSVAAQSSRYFAMDINERDCADIKNTDPSAQDGVYTINPQDGQGPFQVFCDMTTDEGGWTVFQRRIDGTVDFYRNWADYKEGFGDFTGNFWLGNDKIHRLSNATTTQLRIDMLKQSNATGYSKYTTFSLSGETDKYRLQVSGFSGDRGDSLSAQHNGKQFSTKDQDNDDSSTSCAIDTSGAWWYNSCQDSNLNGLYGSGAYGKGLNWVTWTQHYESLKSTEMKLRPQ